MKAPFEEIGAQFEKETGHKIIARLRPVRGADRAHCQR